MDFQLESVSYQYPHDPSNLPALSDISLRLEAGECVALIGPSGAGKTTIAQILNGLLQPTSGALKINGNSLQQKAAALKSLRRQVGLVFQFPEHQIFESTVADEVAFAARQWGIDESKIDLWVGYALQAVGLDPERLRHRNPLKLSGGEARLVSIASLLVVDPEWLILDEPTLGLDFAHRESAAALIQGRKARLRGTFLITHDLSLVLGACPRTVVLNAGQIAFDGPTEDLFFKCDIAAEFNLIEPPLVRYWKLLRETLTGSLEQPSDFFKTGHDLCQWVERQPQHLREQMSSILKQHIDHSISG